VIEFHNSNKQRDSYKDPLLKDQRIVEAEKKPAAMGGGTGHRTLSTSMGTFSNWD
jgi:hypothetical protein